MNTLSKEKMKSANIEQLCGFRIGNGFYAIPVLEVQEVVKPQNMTTVPLSSENVKGLINLRGQIVTALDMKNMFNLKSEAESKTFMNIIVSSGESLYSLIVDQVMDVIEVDTDTFESTPDTLPDSIKKYIKGVYKLSDKLLLRLDLEKVLNFEEAQK